MAFQLHLVTSGKVRLRQILVENGLSSQLPENLSAAAEHRLPLLGLYPGHTHKVSLMYDDEAGKTHQTQPQSVVAPSLPPNFPQLRLKRSSPKASKGFLLFAAAMQAGPGKIPRESFLILCDNQARPLWYMPYQAMLAEITRDADGLWVQSSTGLSITQTDWSGASRRCWQANTLRPAQAGNIPVATDTFHHDFLRDGAGGFWTLGSQLGPPAPMRVVDDLILHLDEKGKLIKAWPVMPTLDPKRRVYEKEFNFWAAFYGPLVEAWGHANSIALDPKGETALVSLRLQDAVVQFDLNNGQPQWILGNPDKWDARCRKLLLTPQGKLQWPARQHSAKWTQNGHILMFDNGRTASRAVEFAVDPKARRVTQSWEFSDDPPFYSTLLGDVDELPNGNVQIVDGWRRGERDHVWARILEVTHDPKPEKLWELEVDLPGAPGCSVYRCLRLDSLY